MTVDQQLRDRFDRATRGVLPTPDLAGAIASGRRRRRVVPIASGLAGAAVAGGVALAAAAAPWSGLDADRAPVAAAPEPTSYVAGTDVDERLAAVVAAASPALPEPADVFPMDWRTPGNAPGHHAPPAGLRLPDEQFADATAWQLRYELAPDHTVLITAALQADGRWPGPACDAEGLLSFGPEGPMGPAGSEGGGPVPSCSYQYSPEDPVTSAYLTQSVDGEPREDVAVAFTENVEDGTEAEGRERALFTDDETLRFMSELDFAPVLARG